MLCYLLAMLHGMLQSGCGDFRAPTVRVVHLLLVVCLRLAPGHIQEVAGHANQFARADLQRLQGTSSYTARHVRCLMLAVCVVIALACIPCSQTHHSREHLLLAFGAGAPPSSCVTNNTFHANDCRCATSCCFQRMLTLAVCMLQPSPHAIHL